MKKIIKTRLDSCYQKVQFGVALIDESDSIWYINPYFQKITGINKEIISKTPFQKLIVERNIQSYLDFKKNFFNSTNSPIILKKLGIKNNNSGETIFDLNIGMEKENEKNFLIMFLIPAKNEEAVIHETNEHPTNAKKPTFFNDSNLNNTLLHKIWNHADSLLFILDKDGYIKQLNPTAENRTGYDSAEIGKNKIDLLNSEQKSRLNQTEWLSLSSYISDLDENNYLEKRTDTSIIKKDGTNLEVALTLVRLPPNEIFKEQTYLGIAEVLEKERILKHELRKTEELVAIRTRFISIASHELRTPLNIILSSATLISKYLELKKTDQIDLHVDRILSSVSYITRLLNDFLTVRKIEEDKIKMEYCSFNIPSYMNETIAELRSLLKNQQDIRYQHEGDLYINLDPKLFKHIVINLISNAIKYSPDNGKIEILSIKKDGYLEIFFKDNGIGISQADQEHLFEKFFRGSNALHIKGTGLGLNIVYNYIKMMKGNIFVKSQLGSGTTFKIVFEN